jgi:hypothetical protein
VNLPSMLFQKGPRLLQSFPATLRWF